MYYFIPSWYDRTRVWQKEAPLWYRVIEAMAFDDTISQIKMFRKGQLETKLLLLAYQPHLRAFLHEQDLLDSPYWSFFDHIQNISCKQAKPFDFKQLNWPVDATFVYSPFLVLVRHQGQTLAQVQFAGNGYLNHVDWLESGQKKMRYYFDDRGFVSSILYFQDDVMHHQDYLNENGVWQVREHLQGSFPPIEVNPDADQDFFAKTYTSWENLMAEQLAKFKLNQMKKGDRLVISANEQHNQLIVKIFPNEKKVFSFFADHYHCEVAGDFALLAGAAQLFVADSVETEMQLLEQIAKRSLPQPAVSRLSPFDTRLRLGHSQTIKQLIVYFMVDGLAEEALKFLMPLLLDMMKENPYIVLQFVTYDPNYPLSQLEASIQLLIEDNYEVEDFYETVRTVGENQLAENKHQTFSKIFFSYLATENALIKTLDTARIVVDLAQPPHIYTQIASLSAGIPQINQVRTDFVIDRENGWILKDLADLPTALHYYFDGLANWNQALVSTVKKMGDYTSGRLLRQWQSLLEEAEDGQN